MVRVSVNLHGENIVKLAIEGHADSSTEMMDVVCAEVSAISVGALNAIDIQCPNTCRMSMKKGYVLMEVLHQDVILQTILKTVVIQLETVEQTNGRYIQVKKAEV